MPSWSKSLPGRDVHAMIAYLLSEYDFEEFE